MDKLFFDINFWQNFVANSCATLLGVIVGIPVALSLDRFFSQRREAEEAKQQLAIEAIREKQLLSAILESLKKNLLLVEQMEREFAPNYVAFYNVDINFLESVASLKYEVIKSVEINTLLDLVKYELVHFHKKVELQLEIEYGPYRALVHYMEKRTELIAAITEHIPPIKEKINRLIQIISRQVEV